MIVIARNPEARRIVSVSVQARILGFRGSRLWGTRFDQWVFEGFIGSSGASCIINGRGLNT